MDVTWCLRLLLFFFLWTRCNGAKQPYVVYMGEHSHGLDGTTTNHEEATKSHYELLGTYLGSERAENAIFYSYNKVINGFAAMLEADEVSAISRNPRVLSVFPNRLKSLHTTHSWEFLHVEKEGRLNQKSIWKVARFGEDTILANLDTGVWPESMSFNDAEMGPVPAKWKGICQDERKVTHCNRKLIGMRYFSKGFEVVAGPLPSKYRTSRDQDGHGTHTLSTAGGGFAPNASIFGYAGGVAKGGSPRARVASYKVCWPGPSGGGCTDADVLAAIDHAIHDGVDVLSLSLGGDAGDYFKDGISIGSFHAVKHGVLVVTSAGNSGPSAASVSNTAPWIFTIAASSIDRTFPSLAKLGNGVQYKGQSISPTHMVQKFYPLINAAEAPESNSSTPQAQLCLMGSLDPRKIKGKVVFCLRGVNARVEKGRAVLMAGGVGMILGNDIASGNEVLSDAHLLPATHITYEDGVGVLTYINSTRAPVAYITPPTTYLGAKPSPIMAAFSSQGPNIINPEILKPDVTAPGVNILAAYSPAADSDAGAMYSLESGTSMACPHVSGVAGLLKTLYPHWSPAAIRSAIMTTAGLKDNMGAAIRNSTMGKATPFSYGSGHMRPNLAMKPGLVYDLTVEDYLNFLCNNGYDSKKMALFSSGYKCPKENSSLLDFNYPSISIPGLQSAITITRRLKNVGAPGTYKAQVLTPLGVSITVEPQSLTFENVGEEKSYRLMLKPENGKWKSTTAFGRITWSDGHHHVRSPIVFLQPFQRIKRGD